MTIGNPLLSPFVTPYGAPDFARVAVADYMPAFDEAMRRHGSEFAAIAGNPGAATFANTIDALELAGEDLDRVSSVFWNLAGTDSTEALRAIEREISPKLSAHWSKLHQDAGVFARIEALWEQAAGLDLSIEQKQVLRKIRTRFIKGGAKLDAADKTRATAIQTRLSELGTAFSQNVLKDETDWSMALSKGDLAGLPAFLVSAAKAEAESRGLEGYAITLSRSSVEPFLTFSTRTDLRARAYAAWTARGDAGSTDNKPLVAEMLQLRAEYARLLGYRDFADMKLADTMAKRTERAAELLETVWVAGKRRAAAERDELLTLAREDGLTAIAKADWRHYAEKLRQKKHALDEAVIKPYFQLE
ncbi:MAG: M3 family metallopeptidase, partial [Beijerinckiaceae bacterium]